MNHYVYTDHSNYPNDQVIFKCDAANILEADNQYQATTGKDPEKQSYIGCQIVLKTADLSTQDEPTK